MPSNLSVIFGKYLLFSADVSVFVRLSIYLIDFDSLNYFFRSLSLGNEKADLYLSVNLDDV